MSRLGRKPKRHWKMKMNKTKLNRHINHRDMMRRLHCNKMFKVQSAASSVPLSVSPELNQLINHCERDTPKETDGFFCRTFCSRHFIKKYSFSLSISLIWRMWYEYTHRRAGTVYCTSTDNYCWLESFPGPFAEFLEYFRGSMVL